MNWKQTFAKVLVGAALTAIAIGLKQLADAPAVIWGPILVAALEIARDGIKRLWPAYVPPEQ